MRFGDVFRTSILGSPTVFITGPRHVATWLDPTKVQREGAMPPNLLALFGGHRDIVPLLDGETHEQRKRCLLAAFSREAVAGYMPAGRPRDEGGVREQPRPDLHGAGNIRPRAFLCRA